MKRVARFSIIGAAILALSACGGHKSSSGGNGCDTVQKLLAKYEASVESYDVDGVADCLDSDFSMTVKDGSLSAAKSRSELLSELESDKSEQLLWRKSSSEGGHGYKLDLKLGTPAIVSTSGGASVSQSFEVWESSSEIATPVETDSGTLAWSLSSSGGEWTATGMTLTFN
jgi:hypothetical protein